MSRLDSDNTKAELASAARDILLEEGLAGLSMRRVAKVCGLSATAIYRHYEDKDALVAGAVLEGFRIFAGYLMDALEKTTPRARFRRICQRYFDFAREHSQDYRLIFMTDCEQLGMMHLDEVSKREISGTFQLLADRVVECQHAGLFRERDPRELAASVWASVHGLCSLLITGNLGASERETQALVKLHLDQIEAGLTR
jgi:AcrR family transcriptional regulator